MKKTVNSQIQAIYESEELFENKTAWLTQVHHVLSEAKIKVLKKQENKETFTLRNSDKNK